MRVLFDAARGQRVPVHLWGRRPPAEAVRYLQRIASQPWVVDHVAGMADLHLTETAAVGTVFATEHFVVPSTLGSDLGCGVAIVPLAREDDSEVDRDTLRALLAPLSGALALHGARRVVEGALAQALAPWAGCEASSGQLTRAVRHHAPRGLGRLGGGNHFMELDRDPSGGLWLQVHSGSGAVGGVVATQYAAVAHAQGAGRPAALDARAGAGEAYLRDALLAQQFACANRRAMVALAEPLLAQALGARVCWDALLDVPHNFVEAVHTELGPRLVHRKGATVAGLGQRAVLPGSMGTATYLVRGRGDARAWGSCSHGAGRVLTRTEARRRVSPEALRAQLRGVVYDEAHAHALCEEAPGAYRDIDEVLEDQGELLEAELRLRPLLVLKE